ncbi:Hypothetical protein A7982_03087 [Minicystis rosea]|nr:Hypothetical protein A7982_03087 [Minicystis rosea]
MRPYLLLLPFACACAPPRAPLTPTPTPPPPPPPPVVATAAPAPVCQGRATAWHPVAGSAPAGPAAGLGQAFVTAKTIQAVAVTWGNGQPAVAWVDERGLHARRLQGDAWRTLGEGPMPASFAGRNQMTLALDEQGAPILAWVEDDRPELHLRTVRWNGGWTEARSPALPLRCRSWDPEFSEGRRSPSIAVDGEGGVWAACVGAVFTGPRPMGFPSNGPSGYAQLELVRWHGALTPYPPQRLADGSPTMVDLIPEADRLHLHVTDGRVTRGAVLAARRGAKGLRFPVSIPALADRSAAEVAAIRPPMPPLDVVIDRPVAADHDRGVIALALASGGRATLHLRLRDGSTWRDLGPGTRSEGASRSSFIPSAPAIALDERGLPVIAYIEQEPGRPATLQTRRSDGVTWSALPPWTLPSGAPGEVAVAVVDGAVVVGLTGRQLTLRRWDGAAWADLPTDTHGNFRKPTRWDGLRVPLRGGQVIRLAGGAWDLDPAPAPPSPPPWPADRPGLLRGDVAIWDAGEPLAPLRAAVARDGAWIDLAPGEDLTCGTPLPSDLAAAVRDGHVCVAWTALGTTGRQVFARCRDLP